MNKVTCIKNENYTTISNVFLRDMGLSLKAKGFLAIVMALPKDWDFSINGITKIIKEGKTAIYSTIDELKEHGYCKVETIRNDKGVIMGNDYTFYEEPHQEQPCLEIPNVDNKAQINKEDKQVCNETSKEEKKEDTNVSPKKKTNYQSIVDCWNEKNGKRLGKVTAITDKRKKLIKHLMDEHSINEKQLIMYLKTIPSADSWLYNPNKQHANWKPDFDWWMRNTNSWFTKLTEGKLHTENPQTFAIIVDGQDAPYTPSGNFSIFYHEQSQAYMYIGYYTDGMPIADGYTDDNRPNGAKLTLNNARGTIQWNSETKTWEKV